MPLSIPLGIAIFLPAESSLLVDSQIHGLHDSGLLHRHIRSHSLAEGAPPVPNPFSSDVLIRLSETAYRLLYPKIWHVDPLEFEV